MSVIGYIRYEDCVFWVGPFVAGSTFEQVGNLAYGNKGTEGGILYGKFVQYPGEAREQPIDPPKEASWNRYFYAGQRVQRILHVNIPNFPGQTWPVGVKVWSETEPEPAWGTPEKTHIWDIQIQEAVRCEDYTNEFECTAQGCWWWRDNTCHSERQPPCEFNTTQSECEAVGCYWYDGSCHFEPPCGQYFTQSDCEASGCYWYNGSCHSVPVTACSQLNNQLDCEDHGCYWWNGVCHSSPPSCSNLNNENDCQRYGCYWYNGTCHSNPPPIACDLYTTQYACEQMECYWYDGACHGSPPITEYLPWILIGCGIAVMVVAVAIPKLKKKP